MGYYDDFIDHPSVSYHVRRDHGPKIHYRLEDGTVLCNCEEINSTTLPSGRKSSKIENVTCKDCLRLKGTDDET